MQKNRHVCAYLLDFFVGSLVASVVIAKLTSQLILFCSL